MVKIAIIGSRTGFNEINVHCKLDIYKIKKTDLIISGGARGIDTYAKTYAIKNDITYKEILPLKYTASYYLYRNCEIINEADIIIAFWNGDSTGTKFVIDYAIARGKVVNVITNDK